MRAHSPRVLLGLAVLVFLILDVASLFVLAHYTTGWHVLFALLGGLVAGILVFKSVGPVTAVRVAGRLRAGEIPGRELVDALLMVAAGALFVFPGLLSDAAALVLVLPGLRAIPRGWIFAAFRRRAVVVAGPGWVEGPPAQGGAIDVEFEER